MKSFTKETLSLYFLYTVALFGTIVLLWGGLYFVWNRYNNYLFEKDGQSAVATIIRKDNGFAYYDIEYNGKYYRDWISLSKKAYRITDIGERFHAVILPDMLKYDHEFGLTPRYIKIILIPLPQSEQNYAEERTRIQSMYDF